jgi:macrolide transport system ATP-binding/permease protein
MIDIVNITKTYRLGKTDVHAIAGLSLTIEQGDFLAIMGPSGSGKSTLAQIIGLLDSPSSGALLFSGKDVSKLEEKELALMRRREVGFVFQQFNLLPRTSALKNVALPLFYSKTGDDSERSALLLEKVGLASRAHHTPAELSGGQQQRVAIARALINNPRVILADEPTGNLDSQSEKEILDLLTELNQQGITIIMVTHEDEIAEIAHRVVRMRDGKVVSDVRNRPIPALQQESTPLSSSLMEEKAHPMSLGSKRKNILGDLFEHFKQGLNSLLANKVRTSLSVLGILIGVAAVVAMLAVGRGAQKSIETQLSSLGSNLLVLRQGSARVAGVSGAAASSLNLSDVEAISKGIYGISRASPIVNTNAQATWGGKNWPTSVQGVDLPWEQIRNSKPTRGRFFTEEENNSRERVGLVGATVVKELFGGQNPIGETIKINKISFQVIGILPVKGNSGFRDNDDVIIIPIKTSMFRLSGSDRVNSIEIEVRKIEDLERVETDLYDFMNNRKKVPESQAETAFMVNNLASIRDTFTKTSKTMSMLLAAIAAISLLVGGIGIMNIMLVSVTERTKEIGLRKAVGAFPSDILMQFLVESVVVSALGGIAGILLGTLITLALGKITGWTTSISLDSIAIALIFSGGIGIIFGIYPAKKASKLSPIQALRSE